MSEDTIIDKAILWMYDLEYFDNIQVQNDMYMSTYALSKKIKDLEIFLNKDKRLVLIYLKLSILTKFDKNKRGDIISSVLTNFNRKIPKFHIVVFTNKEKYDAEITKYIGVKDEANTNIKLSNNE